MKLSALLALLPLAAALPQSRGPVEARAVEVETRSSTTDQCYAVYGNCCDPTKGRGPYNEGTNLMIVACIPNRVHCTTALNECLANATEKRSVEVAPVETRDSNEDECYAAYGNCCDPTKGKGPYNEGTNLMIMACIPNRVHCTTALNECKAKQAEKRSVEEAPLEARDNGSEATTACYGKLASCKHKGTPVAECFGNLSRCIQDVYQKFHG